MLKVKQGRIKILILTRILQDLNKISTRLFIKFHYINTYFFSVLWLERSDREGSNRALFRAIEGIICSSIEKLSSHRDCQNGVLFRYIGSIISRSGYIDVVHVPQDLYTGVCDSIPIYFSLFSFFHVQQIGCYMGFSITASVMAFVMFICYCVAVDEFATIIRCYSNRFYNYSYRYRSCYYYYRYSYSYYHLDSRTASTGAGLGGCLLVCSVVETVIALTASIYCCNAICCGATTTPSVSNKFTQ